MFSKIFGRAPRRLEESHAGAPCSFFQLLIAGCERYAVPDREFQICGIVRRKAIRLIIHRCTSWLGKVTRKWKERTPSAYSLVSSGKHQANVVEASTTIPVKSAGLPGPFHGHSWSRV